MDTYVGCGLGLGAALIVVFVYFDIRRHRFPELVSLIQLVLASSGISAGVRVAQVTITEDNLGPFKAEDRIYLVLGALALAVASCQTLVATFRNAARLPGVTAEQEKEPQKSITGPDDGS